MAKTAKSFATEADLCRRFIAAVGDEWIIYPETAHWDLLLVRKADGFQVGIQAKLRFNTDVINQTLDEYGSYHADRMAPDCRAVLVPAYEGNGFDRICRYIGLTVISVNPERPKGEPGWRWQSRVFEPALPKLDGGANDEWHEWAPTHRHRLPEYVPDVTAGSPSPVQLTSWKIAAIKISIILDKRGYLLRSDFKHINIDHRRWLPSGAGWLTLDAGSYRKAAYYPDFKKQHPRVYDEIAADYDKWKPADPIGPLPLPPAKETLL